MKAPQTKYTRTTAPLLAYQVVGDGRPILLLGDWSVPLDLRWDDPITAPAHERLASLGKLIAFDKRGTGCSERVPLVEASTMESWMEDALTVMDETGTAAAVVMAASESCKAAMLLAATHPERVQALVLINATACWARKPDWPVGFPTEVLERTYASDHALNDAETGFSLFSYRAPSLAGNSSFERRWASWRRLQGGPRVAEGTTRANFASDVRPVAASLRVPTLVLHSSRNEQLRVEAGRATAALIPGARFVEIDSADQLWWAGTADLFLDEIEEFLTGQRPAPVADRVVATVLFTDIVGSTERAGDAGDQAWSRQLRGYEAETRGLVERSGGVLIKTTGDGILATFDGPARAVRCALDLHTLSEEMGLPIRAGLHTGEIERRPDDIAGIGVHIAARVAGLSGAGQTMVSRTVKDLVAGSGLAFDDLGEHELKGIPDRWQLFAVVS